MTEYYTFHLVGVNRWSGLRESVPVVARSLSEAMDSAKTKFDEVYEVRSRTHYQRETNEA